MSIHQSFSVVVGFQTTVTACWAPFELITRQEWYADYARCRAMANIDIFTAQDEYRNTLLSCAIHGQMVAKWGSRSPWDAMPMPMSKTLPSLLKKPALEVKSHIQQPYCWHSAERLNRFESLLYKLKSGHELPY